MRYGIISDIHSNLEALESVEEALSKESLDRFICLGDIVGYGANPHECIDKVRKLSCEIVCGNHDWGAVGLVNIEYFNPAAKKAVLWTKERLNKEEIDFLSSLKLVLENEAGTFVHGTLDRPEEFKYIFGIDDARTTMELSKTRISFVGHSHVHVIFSYSERTKQVTYSFKPELEICEHEKYIVNCGSVGQPRDGDPMACYVIYDTEERKIFIKRVNYDVVSSQNKILKQGLPSILAYRLSQGR